MKYLLKGYQKDQLNISMEELHNATVIFEKENVKIGEYVMVEILDCTSATLIGKIANNG